MDHQNWGYTVISTSNKKQGHGGTASKYNFTQIHP